MAETSRAFIFTREIYPRFTTQDEAAAVSSEQNLEQTVPACSYSGSKRPQTLLSLVVRTTETNQGAGTSKEEPRPEVVLRRLSRGLGSNSGRSPPLRKVDSLGQKIPHQHPRAKGHLVGSERDPPSGSGQDGGRIRGQYDSPVVHCKAGRYEVVDPIQTGGRIVPLDRTTPDNSNSPVYPRGPEYGRGFSKQTRADSPHRVDTPPRCLQRNLEVVGSPNGGPIRHKPDKEAPSLLCSSLGPNVDRDRRHVARLVQHGRLCLSSLRHDKTGPKQIQTERQLQADTDRSMVAAEGMVSRSLLPVSRTPEATSLQQDLLVQPHTGEFHRALHVLSLAAWRLSSDSSGQLAFLDLQPMPLQSPVEPLLHLSTRLDG